MKNHLRTPIRFLTLVLVGALMAIATAGVTQDVSAQSGRGAGKRTTSPVDSTWDFATILGRSDLVRN